MLFRTLSRQTRCDAADEAALVRAIGAWFAESSGHTLLGLERETLERFLDGCFGYYAVQLGALGVGDEPLAACGMRSRVVVVEGRAEAEGCSRIRSELLRLPIATDSVDLVLLPHTLDFFADPHGILREAERILIPEGRIILFGFNPWSLWGIYRLMRLRSRGIPWCGRFLRPRRVEDWLELLGFEVEMIESLMFRPPILISGMRRGLGLLEGAGERFWPRMGGVYAMRAVKRVTRLTPVGPAWKLANVVLGGRVVEPTARSTDHG